MYQRELEVAKRAVMAASKLCQSVRQSTVHAMTKTDQTPVTMADYGSQALICRLMREAFPHDPVVAEEDVSELGQEVLEQVTHQAQQVLVGTTCTAQDVLQWIHHGNGSVRSQGRFWTLDPIDGTKGFLRGDQYAICLALVDEGHVQVGVLGCPALDLDGSVGHLFSAVRGQGCFRESLHDDDNAPPTRVQVSPNSNSMVQSFEASHGNHSAQQDVAKAIGLEEVLRMDSQAKYAMVASGLAALYLRLSDYQENIWDHAAGTLVVQEASGKVTDRNGKSLDFCSGKKMTGNSGVVVSNGTIHDKVLATLREHENR